MTIFMEEANLCGVGASPCHVTGRGERKEKGREESYLGVKSSNEKKL